jgi:hypothetical protein
LGVLGNADYAAAGNGNHDNDDGLPSSYSSSDSSSDSGGDDSDDRPDDDGRFLDDGGLVDGRPNDAHVDVPPLALPPPAAPALADDGDDALLEPETQADDGNRRRIGEVFEWFGARFTKKKDKGRFVGWQVICPRHRDGQKCSRARTSNVVDHSLDDAESAHLIKLLKVWLCRSHLFDRDKQPREAHMDKQNNPDNHDAIAALSEARLQQQGEEMYARDRAYHAARSSAEFASTSGGASSSSGIANRFGVAVSSAE